MSLLKSATLIALGSGLGGTARVAVAAWALTLPGEALLLAILAANIIGSFAIGVAAAFCASAAARQFIMAGFCGGFTTFSLFSLQTWELLESGRTGDALLYSGATLLLTMLAVWAGHAWGERLAPARKEKATSGI